MATRDQFYMALQFLTRLPIPSNVEHIDDEFARSARFYPAIGLVVGCAVALVYAFACIAVSHVVAVVLSIIASIAITGALHEDGLADSADGLFGGYERERILEIMRDSAVGVFGILALLGVFFLKFSALSQMWFWDTIWIIVSAHVISRHAMVEVIHRYDYARAETAKFARPEVGDEDLTYARLWTAATLVAALFLVSFMPVLLGVVLAAVGVALLARAFVSKIGGYTGDCLGATQQLAEVAFLIGAVAWL